MTNAAMIDKMENEWKSLKKLSKDALKAILKRGRRISDLRGMTKMDLMNDIMQDRHGRKRCQVWADATS